MACFLCYTLPFQHKNTIITPVKAVNTININQEIFMSYDEYVAYLLEKYGPAQHDYFCNDTCRSKNSKTSRSGEGLFCHHIAENKEILLSTPEVARTHPFEYQMAKNLVYANYLEHLLLHVKIVEEDVECKGLGLGGVLMISSAINDFYRHGLSDGWRKYATDHIKDKYESYIAVMRYFKNIVESNEFLSKLLIEPVLAQGWYGKICKKVHKDLYGHTHQGQIKWSNSDVLNYLEQLHKKQG